MGIKAGTGDKNCGLKKEESVNTILFFFVSGLYLILVGTLAIITYKSFASPIRKLEAAAKNSIDRNKPFTLAESGPYEIRSVPSVSGVSSMAWRQVKREQLHYSIAMNSLNLKWSNVKSWKLNWFMLKRWKRSGSWPLESLMKLIRRPNLPTITFSFLRFNRWVY